MFASAAVITGKGTGAIATIQICGDDAKNVLEKIFKPSPELKVGKIFVGTISDGSQTIDQVTIGCEGPDTFAINCHGNPLIVERIMQLLQRRDVKLLTAEQLFCRTFDDSNTIALEAKLILPKAKTIEGTRIILNQIDSGLTTTAKSWLEHPADKIAAEANKIIETSRIAKLIIFGCRIVLAGPPNTGKSTLLNRLSGNQKAIVTNIKGTTRDWVSAECRIGQMPVELIDTAGQYDGITDDIDKAAQEASAEVINQADLVLLVLDNSEPVEQLTKSLIDRLAGRKAMAVINKSDLPARFDVAKLPANLVSDSTQISALLGTGLDTLSKKICEAADIENFDPQQPICFTQRQERLLTRLAEVKPKDTAQSIITELLSGPPNV
ncbi:MAG: GTPase [Planctomycetota bacterium]